MNLKCGTLSDLYTLQTAVAVAHFNNAIPMIDKLKAISKKRLVFARYSEFRLQAVDAVNNNNNQVYLELVINFDKGKK